MGNRGSFHSCSRWQVFSSDTHGNHDAHDDPLGLGAEYDWDEGNAAHFWPTMPQYTNAQLNGTVTAAGSMDVHQTFADMYGVWPTHNDFGTPYVFSNWMGGTVQDAFALHFNEHELEVMLFHQHSETTGVSYNWQRARIDNHTHDSESWRH